MLHIILVILKIVGILLATILLLFLLAVCSVLFVPLRYRVSAAKDGDGIRAKGKISWLLHLVTVTAEYRDGSPTLGVRILFLKKSVLPGEEPPQKPQKKQGKKSAASVTPKSREKPEENKKNPEKKKSSEKGKAVRSSARHTEGAKQETLGAESQDRAKREAQEEKPQDRAKPEASGEKIPENRKQQISDTEIPENSERKASEAGASDRGKKKQSLLRILKDRWNSLLRSIKNFLERLKSIPKKISRLIKQGRDAFGKVSEWVSFLFSDMVKAVLRRFRQHLLYLWRHLKPDKIEGKLHYGFDDPSLTGQLTGILYMLLPASCYGIRLEPDFEHAGCEGEIHIKGHIRICHLARVGWKVFRDKEFRKIVKKFQS